MISYSLITDILLKWASNTPPIDEFTVENILAATQLSSSDYEDVYRYLMSKNGFELIALKVVLCPQNHKNDTFLLEEKIEDYFDCPCGETDFEADNLLLVFSFTPGFRNEALKKKTSNQYQVKKKLQMI